MPLLQPERRNQHHKVDNARRCSNADFGESQYERATVAAYFIPREDSNDNENRAYVKNRESSTALCLLHCAASPADSSLHQR